MDQNLTKPNFSKIAELKYNSWRNGLLDLSKRNKMINYRKTKLTNLDIVSPSFTELFDRLANNESIEFKKRKYTDDNQLSGFFYLMDKLGAPVELCDGEIESSVGTDEMNKVLKQIRSKAILASEEQGINILYLSFGFLQWKQRTNEDWISSPLILVPVYLEKASITTPFKIRKLDEDIVLNPTLDYALSQDNYKIQLPDFDLASDSLTNYLNKVQITVKENGWKVTNEVCLGHLSFLKIVMFKDLEKNKKSIFENPVIRAFCGDSSELNTINPEWMDYDHDKEPYSDNYQVIDADSSQQDAILLAKKGVSFVLQGPPGTGKSQTIANIIACLLAENKRVLFVSEKMAALSVVYKRLSDVKLADYCLPLHNYKTEKKAVIKNLLETLDAPVVHMKKGADNFVTDLEKDRNTLNLYFRELHKNREPLNKSLYETISELSCYEPVPLYPYPGDPLQLTDKEYSVHIRQLKKYREYLKTYGRNIKDNPWYKADIPENIYNVEEYCLDTVSTLSEYLQKLIYDFDEIKDYLKTDELTWYEICAIFTSVKGFILSSNLKNSIEQYYTDKIKAGFSKEDYTVLYERYNDLLDRCDRFEYDLRSIEEKEKRKQITASFEKKWKEVKSIEAATESINSYLGTNFDLTKGGLTEIVKLASVMLSCERIESNWLLLDRYEKAGTVLKAGKNAYNQIKQARERLAEVVNHRLLVYASDAKSLVDTADYHLEAVNKLSSLYSKYRDILDVVNYSHLLYAEPNSKNDVLKVINEEKEIEKELGDIVEFLDSLNHQFQANIEINEAGLKKAIVFISVLYQDGRPLPCWIEADDIDYYERLRSKQEKLALSLKKLREELSLEWSSDIYKIDCNGMLTRFRTEYQSFFKRMGSQYKEDKQKIIYCRKHLSGKIDDSECLKVLELLKNYYDTKAEFDYNSGEAEKVFGDYYHGEATNWENLKKGIAAGQTAGFYRKVYGMSDAMEQICCSDYEIRKGVKLGGYRVSDLDGTGVFDRMFSIISLYKGKNLDEELNKKREEISCLQLLVSIIENIETFVITDAENWLKNEVSFILKPDIMISSLLEYIVAYKNLCATIKDYLPRVPDYVEFFPDHYDGFNTDWDALSTDYSKSNSFINYIRYHSVSSEIKTMMCEPKETRRCLQLGSYSLEELGTGKIISDHSGLLSEYDDLHNVEEEYHCFLSACDDYDSLMMTLSNIVSERAGCTYLEDYMFFVDKYCVISRALQNKYTEFENHIVASTAEDTNISFLIDQLNDYLTIAELNNAERDFITNYPELHTKDALNEIREIFGDTLISFQDDIISSMELFSQWFVQLSLNDLSLCVLNDKIAKCNDADELQSWLEYASIRKECTDAGLEDYMCYLEDENVANKWSVSAYVKGVLTKWYQSILSTNNLQYFLKFQAPTHISTIENYRKLDLQHFPLVQGKLNEMLSGNKPTGLAGLTNAMDEVAILRKEGQKVRNIMPLRKLFRTIPGLLMKLKPCFMMSPLSVSYFLDSSLYKFDTVIFDEASQILPEDAIGAIYRGKQVIIAGDTKQMPPSSFFTKTAKDNSELDVDEDDDDYYINDVLSESVLDEANILLPACNLNWHYRSKDESLIAFSNKELYGNRLITFPNCKKQKDSGLEYIYVRDGYYEGKPRNCNIREAKKCVELVEEHIKNHSDRSLGIIAFSEKQQTAIEDAVFEWRLKNPLYEDFFDENKPEPFFVKNLENVQGDERDTIIFSICYARNKQGKMFMRFGPLGNAGGERRLNVAITRAKYNVKLVGSIYPNDLTITDDTALGVKLLAKYITYAMQNDYELPGGENILTSEEHFADIVADFVRANGYQVRRNVGSSKYKIDIAVVKPGNENEYFAGIECDGFNYSSARTAKDRDVSRKALLEKMGWNLFHVWSVGWNRNPEGTRNALLYYLQNYAGRGTTRAAIRPNTRPYEFDDITFETKSVSSGPRVQHIIYHCSDINDPEFRKISYNKPQYNTYLEYVLYKECPIHNELLATRMAIFEHRQSPSSITYTNLQKRLSEINRGRYIYNSGFWYRKGVPIVAREPENDEGRRKFEHIAPEEIQDAMMTIMHAALSLQEKDLFNATAKIFGWQRLSPNSREILTKHYYDLCAKGKLVSSDGKAFLKESSNAG